MKIYISALILGMVSSATLAVPERPVIDRTIHMAEDHVMNGPDRHWIRPYIPPLTTSADSRIGLAHRPEFSGPGGNFGFRLLKPEKISEPFLMSPDGMELLNFSNSRTEGLAGLSPNTEVSGGKSSHATLCDPSGDPKSTIKNPYACGINDNDDCYDLVVIRMRNQRLHGTHVNVRVENPKTLDARVAEVSAIKVDEGQASFPFGAFFEPTVTGDGHLLVVRKNGGRFPWRTQEGTTINSTSDIVYFVNDNPDDFAGCDVNQWDSAYPIGHAPYDTTINTRYGFAMNKFRDGMNNELPDGQGFGTYPWIDKSGGNITFTTLGSRLTSSGYTLRCPAAVLQKYGTCNNATENSLLNGRAVLGLWTRGKIVLLDNLINNMDHNVAVQETSHKDVLLYEISNTDDGYKRVGDTRQRDHDIMPPGSSGNSNFFDSNEHRFNYFPNMSPITPGDVTWLMSSGRTSDEVPFDDYLNANSFIVSHMVQAIQIRQPDGLRIQPPNRLQNSATSTEWSIPLPARVVGGGRWEIIANGGIQGKGFWLDGANIGLEYDIPAQDPKVVLDSPWYYSLFIDSRSNVGERALLSFPDNSEIRVRGDNRLVFIGINGTELHTVDTRMAIPNKGWAHLGFQLSNNNQTIETYVNGYKVDTYNNSQALFVLNPGVLTVGSSTNDEATSFRGWIDDFKVFAEKETQKLPVITPKVLWQA